MVFGIYFYNIILESILTCWRYLKRGSTGIIIGNRRLSIRKKYLGDAYGDEDEVFYCPKVILTGLRIMVLAVLHFAFPYLEKHRLVVQDLIA